MTIRFTVSIIMLLLIITLGLCCVIFTKDYCEMLIDETNKALIEKDMDAVIMAQSKWKKIVLYLSIVIPHEHIDDTSEAFERAIMFLRFDTEDEFSAEMSKIISNIEIIKSYDYPSLRSIF